VLINHISSTKRSEGREGGRQGSVAHPLSCVPFVLPTSTRKTCPLRNSICEGDVSQEDKQTAQTLAWVVEISLSLYRLTPFSRKRRPVDRPILKTSSPFSFAGSNRNFCPRCAPAMHFNVTHIFFVEDDSRISCLISLAPSSYSCLSLSINTLPC
jgi:hypothetical protein